MVTWPTSGGGGAMSYWRGSVDEEELTNGVNNLSWTTSEDFASGPSVGANGRVVVDQAGVWQVSMIGYGYPDDGVSDIGRIDPYVKALNGAGSVVDSSFGHRAYFHAVDGLRADWAFTDLLEVPSGGAITGQVGHNNTGSTVWVAYRLSMHYVGPA